MPKARAAFEMGATWAYACVQPLVMHRSFVWAHFTSCGIHCTRLSCSVAKTNNVQGRIGISEDPCLMF